ncbi:MAG: hypothetical protein ACP5RS_06400 [Thermoplasmata archaeon]
MLKDEKISSLKSPETLVLFIGFRKHLVMEFLKTFKSPGIEHIVIFYSKKSEGIDRKNLMKNKKLINDAILFIKNNFNKNLIIKEMEIGNIWSFNEFYNELHKINAKKAILNISAGPSTFSAAGILWAIEKKHYIAHSVEFYLDGKLSSCIFNLINVNPYVSSIFETDNLDKMIINCLRNGAKSTVEICEIINDNMHYKISLRSIEMHIKKLNNLGILDISKGKVNRISFSTDLEKVLPT